MRTSIMNIAALLAATAFALPAVPNISGPLHAPPKKLKSLAFPDISAIMGTAQSSFKSYNKGSLVRESHNRTLTHAKRDCPGSPILTWGDTDYGGKGIVITNADNDWRGFYVYHNSCKLTVELLCFCLLLS
jgi:hypothetical protein